MLEVRGLSASYGKHRALEDVSLRVTPGEIVVILGANGAGKSTLLKSICGICEGHVTGDVRIEGTELSGMKPNLIVEEGVALVPEGRGIFPDLSVQENLLLGSYSSRARDEEAASLERVLSLFPKLAERRKQVVRTMSGGEQQMVAIGRAMMSNPTILALDEPSLGLSPLLSKELFQSLKRVKDAGLGILMVEQNARQSLAIADRGYLLENGQIAHEDRAANLLTDPAVTAAYLGGKRASGPPGSSKPIPVAPPSQPRTPAESISNIAQQAMASFEQKRPQKAATLAVEQAQKADQSRPDPVAMPTARQTALPAEAAPTPTPKTSAKTYGMDLNALVASAAAQSSRKGRELESGRLPTRPEPAPAPAVHPSAKIQMPSLESSGDRLQTILREIEEAARRAEQSRTR